MSDETEVQYWVQLDENNIAGEVMVVMQDFMIENPDQFQGRWVQTYFNTEGKTYAGSGYRYDEEADDFIAPEPSEYWKQAVGWVE